MEEGLVPRRQASLADNVCRLDIVLQNAIDQTLAASSHSRLKEASQQLATAFKKVVEKSRRDVEQLQSGSMKENKQKLVSVCCTTCSRAILRLTGIDFFFSYAAAQSAAAGIGVRPRPRCCTGGAVAAL